VLVQMDPLLQVTPGVVPSVFIGLVLQQGQYQGFCIGGQPDGRGTWRYNNGDSHVGDYRAGRFHGRGTVTWANGNVYVGQFVGGMPEGQGTLTQHNGQKYEGVGITAECMGLEDV
jgi:hypothetical protein